MVISHKTYCLNSVDCQKMFDYGSLLMYNVHTVYCTHEFELFFLCWQIRSEKVNILQKHCTRVRTIIFLNMFPLIIHILNRREKARRIL